MTDTPTTPRTFLDFEDSRSTNQRQQQRTTSPFRRVVSQYTTTSGKLSASRYTSLWMYRSSFIYFPFRWLSSEFHSKTRVSAPCTNRIGGLSTCERKPWKEGPEPKYKILIQYWVSPVQRTDSQSLVGLKPSPSHPLFQKSELLSPEKESRIPDLSVDSDV